MHLTSLPRRFDFVLMSKPEIYNQQEIKNYTTYRYFIIDIHFSFIKRIF